MDIKELRRQRKELIEKCRAMLDKAEQESRELSEAETQEYRGYEAQIDAMQEQIERESRLQQREAELRGGQKPPTQTDVGAYQPVFSSLGDQLLAVRQAAIDPRNADKRLYEVRAPLGANVSAPSEGGFLMETQYSAGIWKRTYETGQVLSRCFRVAIGDQADSVVINGLDETSRATGSRWGGVRGYWVAEAATITASQPKFTQIRLSPHKLAVLVYATSEMLRNPSVLESVVSQVVPQEIVFMSEDAIVNGPGAGMPLGVMNSACRIDVAAEAGQAADTVVAENISKMWSRLWARSRGNAVWLINQDVEPQLDQLSLVIGAGGVPMYLPSAGLTEEPFYRLKGRPVVPVEYCDTVGDLGDIILADFSQYAVTDRGAVQAASSIHVQFLTDQTCFRFIYEIDGQPLWPSALTPKNSTSTLSPFVALAAR